MWLEPQKCAWPCIPVYCDSSIQRVPRDRRGRDRMVMEFKSTYAISTYY
jgi:hypothetical protein